jgi:trimethylamine-N-oxide reductase (cytochrome c)
LGTGKAHELATPSGKIEFVAESLKKFKPNDPGRPPMPKYIHSWEGHHSEAYEKYALQLISPHPRFSFHTHYDHASWLDEIKDYRIRKSGYAYWVARINPKDAITRNVMDGDLIEMYNDRGSVVCCAIVTYRVPLGVVHSYASCGKYDPVAPVPGAADRGGCINILTPDRYISEYAIGMAPNSCLIEFRKWED